jgi:hypothetical protein
MEIFLFAVKRICFVLEPGKFREALKKYYIDVNGKTNGPFTLDQLRAMWSSRKITGRNRYCIEGSDKWTNLEMLQSVLEEKEKETSAQNSNGYFVYVAIALILIVVAIFAAKCGSQQ